MSDYFQILKNSSRENNAGTLPSGAAARGLAYQWSATAGTVELADGTGVFAGFVTRTVGATAPTVEQHMLVNGIIPATGEIGLLPFTGGEVGAFEFADEVDVEGSAYIDDVVAGTALKTALSFSAGKFHIATTGQLAEFMLKEKPTPRESANVRIIAARCEAFKVTA